MSRAIHAVKAGAIFDTIPTSTGVIGLTEPSPEEREFRTTSPAVTAAQRHTVTSNYMDQRCLSHLINHRLNTCAQQNVGHFVQPPVPVRSPCEVIRGGEPW